MHRLRRFVGGAVALSVIATTAAGCGSGSTSEDIEKMEGGAETGIENDVQDVPGEGTDGGG